MPPLLWVSVYGKEGISMLPPGVVIRVLENEQLAKNQDCITKTALNKFMRSAENTRRTIQTAMQE